MSPDPAPADPTRFNPIPTPPRRPVRRALMRGFRKRCTNCGRGRILVRYLKATPNCSVCGEDLSHHRADDAPPYLTIVVAGHIIVPLILFVETRWPLAIFVHLAIWLPLTLLLCLTLLPMMKGAVVGLQWALRMHGFDQSDEAGPTSDGEFGQPASRAHR